MPKWFNGHEGGIAVFKEEPEIGIDWDAVDWDRVDEAAVALLLLGLHDGWRTWKGFDWDVMNRLHDKGFITNPRTKAKSVLFTDEGIEASQRCFEELFLRRGS